jgi:hypothetical protein
LSDNHPTEGDMSSNEKDQLRGKLDQIENRLQAALGEVCEDTSVTGVRKPDTGELIRIDETLALASEAAKQAISLRRRLRADAKKGTVKGESSESTERAP